MKQHTWLTFLLAALASAAIWALTPMLTNHREPWDSEGIFYLLALGIAAPLPALSRPDRYGPIISAPSPVSWAMN